MSNYYSVKAISNSALSYLDYSAEGSLQKFRDFMEGTLPDTETTYQRLGSLIHLYILEPEKFKVADVEKPSDAVCAIVDELFKVLTDDEFEELGALGEYKSTIGVLVEEFNYQSNWKLETRINKLIELGEDYFEYLKMVKTSPEIVLTSKEFATIMACSASIKSDPHISKILFPEDVSNDVEILNEEEIYFDFRGFACKAKIDRLIVNHKKKTFAIVDLKTTSKSINKFNEYFNLYDYGRQFSFYSLAAMQKYPGYSLSMAACIATETTGYNRSRLFIVPHSVISIRYRAIDRLFDIIKSCTETGNWVYEPEYLNEPYEIQLV